MLELRQRYSLSEIQLARENKHRLNVLLKPKTTLTDEYTWVRHPRWRGRPPAVPCPGYTHAHETREEIREKGSRRLVTEGGGVQVGGLEMPGKYQPSTLRKKSRVSTRYRVRLITQYEVLQIPSRQLAQAWRPARKPTQTLAPT